MSKRAQIAIIDLLFALIIFIALFLGFVLFWTLYEVRLTENMRREEIELLAFQVSNALVKTPGYPSNWEMYPNLTLSPGLASSDGVLSPAKIATFRNFTYNQTKAFFNIERYEYYLLIQKNATVVYETNNTPSGKIVSVRRNVWYENQEAKLDFALWA